MKITLNDGTMFPSTEALKRPHITSIKVEKADRPSLRTLFARIPSMEQLQEINLTKKIPLKDEDFNNLSETFRGIKGSKITLRISRVTYEKHRGAIDRLTSENKHLTVSLKEGYMKKSISQDSLPLNRSGDSIFLNWSEQYYPDKARQPKDEPYETVKQTIETHWKRLPGVCLDFGCGDGKDALYLLRHGWTVYGLDCNDESLNMLRSNALRILAPKILAKKLITLNTEFIDLPPLKDKKGNLIEINLFNASLTLPYRTPKNFPPCWQKIVKILKPGAFFTGHFFGEKHFSFPNEGMTFHKVEKLKEMIKDHFRIVYFDEIKELLPCASDEMLFWHRFDVIAIRKSSYELSSSDSE